MEVKETVNQINKTYVDALIEKMDKLMKLGEFNYDNALLKFWFCNGDPLKWWFSDEDVRMSFVNIVQFSMAKLRAGDTKEIETAIKIITKIENGEWDFLLTEDGGVLLSEVFE